MATKAEVWSAHLAACRASGLSAAAFCREHGLAYAQYMYWQHRLGQGARGLVPVRVEAPRTAVAPLSVEVAVASVAVRVQGITLAEVVAWVRGLAC
ncbi:MAG: IS66 family insertion sequence element accessory protein TnpA [Rhodanobacteraceae bacterium]